MNSIIPPGNRQPMRQGLMCFVIHYQFVYQCPEYTLDSQALILLCGKDFESICAPASLPQGYRILKQNKQLSEFFSLSRGGNFMRSLEFLYFIILIVKRLLIKRT